MQDEKKKDERPKVPLWKVIAFGLKINIKNLPFTFLIINTIAVIHGISYGFSTFVTQYFYDSVGDVITRGESVNRAYWMIAALGLTFIFREVLNGTHNFMHSVVFGKTTGVMNRTIHEKMARIDPICLEDTKLHDDIEKAKTGSTAVMNMVNMGITIFTFYAPYFIFMGFYLHYLKPQFVLAIILVFVPVLFSQVIRTGIIAKFQDKAAPINRESSHYYWVVVGGTWLKETRILGAYPFFLNKLMKTLKNLGKAEWTANKKTNILEFGMGLISAGGYAGIIFMLVNALLSGEITVGAFAAVFSSIGMLFMIMQEMINSHIGNMAANMGQAHNFIRFMELPERGGETPEPSFDKGIQVENISFTYPHAESKSLDGISLEIKAGETVAIVGENGAGKTTLVRLLMGLYTPTEGKIRINGMDTAATAGKSLFKGQSGVFQKYQRYQMTLQENVQISSYSGGEAIDKALEQAGVDVTGKSFPDGAETMLSREFDGVDLSGGEWQRVALARGLYRSHNMVVLDEPTAAIDPIEESRIYNKFIEISRDKTAVIVTHRLGSTKIADRVIVMEKGKIADIGSHYELMQRPGLYADMYNAQAGWYEE